jgi:hypothetical protein
MTTQLFPPQARASIECGVTKIEVPRPRRSSLTERGVAPAHALGCALARLREAVSGSLIASPIGTLGSPYTRKTGSDPIRVAPKTAQTRL